MNVNLSLRSSALPHPSAVLELLKPITWFPPMWAYACGVVSSGVSFSGQWGLVFLGVLLAGPIVCGMSQAANDWCDRHVDAINEPHRPIPSGRIPGRWGLWIAIFMSVFALFIGYLLGQWGFYATCVGVAAAWIYSAEPFRWKKSGWWGPGLVGLCYEGLPWFTGAAVMMQARPSTEIIALAAAYAISAHGIMTLNDFKALKGDHATGIHSLPVVYGPERAAKIACAVMIIPQFVVVGLLINWGLMWAACIVGALIVGQALAMRRLLRDPERFAPWYNGTGVAMSVSGMMVCAVALRLM